MPLPSARYTSHAAAYEPTVDSRSEAMQRLPSFCTKYSLHSRHQGMLGYVDSQVL
jgi:hypothetical protein